MVKPLVPDVLIQAVARESAGHRGGTKLGETGAHLRKVWSTLKPSTKEFPPINWGCAGDRLEMQGQQILNQNLSREDEAASGIRRARDGTSIPAV